MKRELLTIIRFVLDFVTSIEQIIFRRHASIVGMPPLLAIASGSGGQPKRVIRAGRRRPSEPTEPGERERAEAPRRRREGEVEERPSPGGVGGMGQPQGPSGGASLFGGAGRGLDPRMLVILVVVVICLAIFGIPLGLFPGSQEPGGQVMEFPTEEEIATQAFVQPTIQPTLEKKATATPRVSAPTSVAFAGQKWLVMLYQDADDKILEQDIYFDLNEAERVGSTEQVKIVAQVDRFRAGYQGDGNWTSTKRFYVTRNDDLQSVSSREVADLGEVNMSDGNTLVDFVTWAIREYPADKYVLILSDHGMGWPGGWSDPAPGGRGDSRIPLSSAIGDQLYLNELDQALGEIRSRTGIGAFELIGMDACLMGHVEVLTALAPHARYAVVSQETEPALGWAYTSFLSALQENPGIDGAELSRLIVQSYIKDDQRIVDEEARAEFLRQGSPMGSLPFLMGGISAQQLARQMEDSITLTAADLSAVPELVDRLNDLSVAMMKVSQQEVARARSYAQSFTSIFGREVPPSYIDLGNFVQLLAREVGDVNITQASNQLLQVLDKVVIAEKHGAKKPGATGVSIYFPNSQLYKSPMAGPQSYTVAAERFAEASLWDDFLAYHYTGRTFKPATKELVVPEVSVPVRAPGAGRIQISPISLSSNYAAPGKPVILSADITGQNLGYIYLFVGFYDAQANSIFVADMDYLESAETREIDGVYYPDWGEPVDFTLEFEWEPLMFAISDGVNSVTALLSPQSYGAAPEEAVYTVDGIYTYADGGESRYARLYFSNGVLRQVFGFTGEEFSGSPREIIPQSGDTFTILEKWMDLDASGKVVQVVTQEGGMLTFGDQMFTWKELSAAAGKYIVGFIIEDLDGNQSQVFVTITVR